MEDLSFRDLRGPRGDQFFTVEEVARRLAFSTSKIRRMFENEPGVIKVGNPSRRLSGKLKRRYYTLRIPQSAYDHMIKRCSGR